MIAQDVNSPMPVLFFGSGQQIDVFRFERQDLPPNQLGRTLSRINRFSGNGDIVISVAQHSETLSRVVGPCQNMQRAALMHDVPETFTGDIPTPIKRRCPEILAIDARIIARISDVFHIPLWAFAAIHEKDSRISFDERLVMFENLHPVDREKAEANRLGIHVPILTAEIAALRWIDRFNELFKGYL